MHEPAPVRWTAEPFAVTVQLPPAVNVTSRPEDAVALTGKSAAPMALSASGANVIVCDAGVTVSVLDPLAAR